MYSRTLLDILFLIWGQTVADYKMLSFHLSINVIIIVVSFKILDLCPIALFQKLWNTLYTVQWHKKRGSAWRTICILYQQTSPKCWCGNMNMTSNCDVTKSAHQIQMTTTCHWMKTPMKIFCLHHCKPAWKFWFERQKLETVSEHFIKI